MADVKIVDIDGEQWNIKDQNARDRITALEDSLSAKDLPDAQITMKDGYTCDSIRISDCYKVGKINFALMSGRNLSGNGVGGAVTICIASTNLTPKKSTTFIVRDYLTSATVRCILDQDGSLSIGESNGIKNGENAFFGEIIFAEP